MKSILQVFVLYSASFVTATNISFTGGFNRVDCYTRTLDLIHNGSLLSNDEVFFRDNDGQAMSSPDTLTLTLPGCQQLCGRRAWYWDIGPRLSTWLIPILLLLGNIELSPLGKRRFMALIHLLGDPMDSMWSLLHKIDAWDHCYVLAKGHSGFSNDRRRVIATVFAGFEEIYGPSITSVECFDSIATRSGVGQEEKFREWRRTALELADSRTDEFLRSRLAILLYFYQVIAGFVKEVGGGNTSPPGGRIGTAMFISWLVTAVLLSNAIGGFTSRRTCFDILSRFNERTNNRFRMPPSYFESQSWSGAIYTFRPWKTRYITGETGRVRTALLLLLAVLPIWAGMTGGFIIIWYTLPNGFNCRHFWLIGIFVTWHLSAVLTWLSYTPKFTTGKYHWHFILVKDAAIAIPSIVVIFLSSCGLFNSCFCWSGFFYYRGRAHVPLNTDQFYQNNDRTIYPAVVTICLFFQCAVFFVVTVVWRKGLEIMRWSENARHQEWETARREHEAARREHEETARMFSHGWGWWSGCCL